MSVQSIADIPPALITASAAFVGGILGTLLTIFVTPRFQHYFWKRQKREELRLAVVTEVNRLAAEFQSNDLLKDHLEDTSERGLRSAQSWIAVNGQVKDLFLNPHFKRRKGCIDMSSQLHSLANEKLWTELPVLENLRRYVT